MVRTILGALAFTLVVATGSPDLALAKPMGPEFPVNTYTKSSQGLPRVSAFKGGGFVVVWISTGQDGSDDGIYGRQFNKDGEPIRKEFRANTYKANPQAEGDVAVLVGGGFVVVWQSYGQDGSGNGVYGQIFDKKTKKAGNEFRINKYVTDEQTAPRVASLTGGGFVVVWQSYGQDGSGYGVYGQRYAATGAKVGKEFRINQTKTGTQGVPRVAGLTGGGFVVAWQAEDQDGDDYGVYARRYRPDGTAASGEFRVNTYVASQQKDPSIAPLIDGGFVVVWTSYGQEAPDYGVYGQRFRANGKTKGKEFHVNTETADSQQYAAAAGLTDGGFAVVWESNGQDGSDYGVYGQRFDSAGAKSGKEFRANQYTMLSQADAAIAGFGSRFVVTWDSNGQDGDSFGVYARRFK